MFWSFLTMLAIGVDAGPALPSCDNSVVTLVAEALDPPANYEIRWEGQAEAGIFLTVAPSQTTTYTVSLTDLSNGLVYTDEVSVLVAPNGSDLFPDNILDIQDWRALYHAWGNPPQSPEFDPDGDGLVTVLDWFWICNFDDIPQNSPPRLIVEQDLITYQNETLTIQYQIEDDEQTPSLLLGSPQHGAAFLLAGQLRYIPDTDYVGLDSFEVQVTDGLLITPPVRVDIDVLAPENWSDLYNDIFNVRCFACHIDAVSGGLSLLTYNLAQTGGNSGAGFLAGNPSQSPIYLRVSDGSMPLGQTPLSSQDVSRIRLWILRGAQEF